jgi:hypothetical protein
MDTLVLTNVSSPVVDTKAAEMKVAPVDLDANNSSRAKQIVSQQPDETVQLTVSIGTTQKPEVREKKPEVPQTVVSSFSSTTARLNSTIDVKVDLPAGPEKSQITQSKAWGRNTSLLLNRLQQSQGIVSEKPKPLPPGVPTVQNFRDAYASVEAYQDPRPIIRPVTPLSTLSTRRTKTKAMSRRAPTRIQITEDTSAYQYADSSNVLTIKPSEFRQMRGSSKSGENELLESDQLGVVIHADPDGDATDSDNGETSKASTTDDNVSKSKQNKKTKANKRKRKNKKNANLQQHAPNDLNEDIDDMAANLSSSSSSSVKTKTRANADQTTPIVVVNRNSNTSASNSNPAASLPNTTASFPNAAASNSSRAAAAASHANATVPHPMSLPTDVGAIVDAIANAKSRENMIIVLPEGQKREMISTLMSFMLERAATYYRWRYDHGAIPDPNEMFPLRTRSTSFMETVQFNQYETEIYRFPYLFGKLTIEDVQEFFIDDNSVIKLWNDAKKRSLTALENEKLQMFGAVASVLALAHPSRTYGSIRQVVLDAPFLSSKSVPSAHLRPQIHVEPESPKEQELRPAKVGTVRHRLQQKLSAKQKAQEKASASESERREHMVMFMSVDKLSRCDECYEHTTLCGLCWFRLPCAKCAHLKKEKEKEKEKEDKGKEHGNVSDALEAAAGASEATAEPASKLGHSQEFCLWLRTHLWVNQFFNYKKRTRLCPLLIGGPTRGCLRCGTFVDAVVFEGPRITCDKCGLAFYCSEQCQRLDSQYQPILHSTAECDIWKAVSITQPNNQIGAYRLVGFPYSTIAGIRKTQMMTMLKDAGITLCEALRMDELVLQNILDIRKADKQASEIAEDKEKEKEKEKEKDSIPSTIPRVFRDQETF